MRTLVPRLTLTTVGDAASPAWGRVHLGVVVATTALFLAGWLARLTAGDGWGGLVADAFGPILMSGAVGFVFAERLLAALYRVPLSRTALERSLFLRSRVVVWALAFVFGATAVASADVAVLAQWPTVPTWARAGSLVAAFGMLLPLAVLLVHPVQSWRALGALRADAGRTARVTRRLRRQAAVEEARGSWHVVALSAAALSTWGRVLWRGRRRGTKAAPAPAAKSKSPR